MYAMGLGAVLVWTTACSGTQSAPNARATDMAARDAGMEDAATQVGSTTSLVEADASAEQDSAVSESPAPRTTLYRFTDEGSLRCDTATVALLRAAFSAAEDTWRFDCMTLGDGSTLAMGVAEPSPLSEGTRRVRALPVRVGLVRNGAVVWNTTEDFYRAMPAGLRTQFTTASRYGVRIQSQTFTDGEGVRLGLLNAGGDDVVGTSEIAGLYRFNPARPALARVAMVQGDAEVASLDYCVVTSTATFRQTDARTLESRVVSNAVLNAERAPSTEQAANCKGQPDQVTQVRIR
jgi:hypothetical protein